MKVKILWGYYRYNRDGSKTWYPNPRLKMPPNEQWRQNIENFNELNEEERVINDNPEELYEALAELSKLELEEEDESN